jgi:dihydrofolate reductase
MIVSMIAATDRHGLIGDGGGIPWHLPKDLRRFRALTWGKPVIMGRKTFESIGKPLPGRFNIVLSQNPDFIAPGCRVVRALQEALAVAEGHLATTGGDEVMIIGGGKVYAEALPLWDRLYLTVVDGRFDGATYFPVRGLLRQAWRPARDPEIHADDDKNPYPHSFHILERDRGDLPTRPAAEGPLDGCDLVAILRRGNIPSVSPRGGDA